MVEHIVFSIVSVHIFVFPKAGFRNGNGSYTWGEETKWQGDRVVGEFQVKKGLFECKLVVGEKRVGGEFQVKVERCHF